MRYYAGLDLHSNNTYLGILDEKGTKVYKAKVANDLQMILNTFQPYREKMAGAVVESTFNWYWLVDGLIEEGYKLHLANPAAIKQYEGLKHTNDYYDAFFLADLLRLGVLKEGHIYPKKERALRDLLRKRLMLVQQRTSHILSFQSLYNREKGCKFLSNEIKRLREEDIETLFTDKYVCFSAQANISFIHSLTTKIKEIETAVLECISSVPEFVKLKTVTGVGDILALTILLETGNIGRFPKVGNYSSYCRCVSSQRLSNEKKKGENNRKLSKTNKIVAIKALAHKLARASYYVMRDRVDYNPKKAFG